MKDRINDEIVAICHKASWITFMHIYNIRYTCGNLYDTIDTKYEINLDLSVEQPMTMLFIHVYTALMANNRCRTISIFLIRGRFHVRY